MDTITQTHLNNLYSQDRNLQNEAYAYIMAATEQPVSWAYAAWDELVEGLSDPDNHIRAIAAQVLCNLAKSDPDGRILADFEALLEVTRDQRFVTARHCLQSLWKIGSVGAAQQELLIAGLDQRYQECINERNCTLIRYDIIEGLKKLYDEIGDDSLRETALAWIEQEDDLKYRRKYAKVWK